MFKDSFQKAREEEKKWSVVIKHALTSCRMVQQTMIRLPIKLFMYRISKSIYLFIFGFFFLVKESVISVIFHTFKFIY